MPHPLTRRHDRTPSPRPHHHRHVTTSRRHRGRTRPQQPPPSISSTSSVSSVSSVSSFSSSGALSIFDLTPRQSPSIASGSGSGVNHGNDDDDGTNDYFGPGANAYANAHVNAHANAHANNVVPEDVGDGDGPLWCEFRDLTGCRARFGLGSVDAWIRHHVDRHFGPQALPRRTICWFCDEVEWNADRVGVDTGTAADLLNLYVGRMRHIADAHIRLGASYDEMRQDFPMLQHMAAHHLISSEAFRNASAPFEFPDPGGLCYVPLQLLQHSGGRRAESPERPCVITTAEDRRRRRREERRGRDDGYYVPDWRRIGEGTRGHEVAVAGAGSGGNNFEYEMSGQDYYY